eukprot:14249948-Heterocapsa_arctica.AAC.1
MDAVLPKHKGKLNVIALRVPTPNVSIVDLLVKTGKKADKQAVNAALKATADGPMKDITNLVTQPLVITLRVPTPNVSIVDPLVKTCKKTDKEAVNAAPKATTDGPMKGIINFVTQPL